MFSVSNTTGATAFDFANNYQNHAVLDCASWEKTTEPTNAKTFDDCMNIQAGSCTEVFESTNAVACTFTTTNNKQVVQFRLRDRYGNSATASKEFTVTGL